MILCSEIPLLQLVLFFELGLKRVVTIYPTNIRGQGRGIPDLECPSTVAAKSGGEYSGTTSWQWLRYLEGWFDQRPQVK